MSGAGRSLAAHQGRRRPHGGFHDAAGAAEEPGGAGGLGEGRIERRPLFERAKSMPNRSQRAASSRVVST